LVKDHAALEAAYNDAAGVTAEFNRNILRVVNRSLGADFQPDAFRHHAFYNAAEQRIEMHLVSARAQRVHIRAIDLTLRLEASETIWTEGPYKFPRASPRAMLAGAGLRPVAWHTDADERFALVLAAPRSRAASAPASRAACAGSDTPTPTRLYIHDDLLADVRERCGAQSVAAALAQELMTLAQRDPEGGAVLARPGQM